MSNTEELEDRRSSRTFERHLQTGLAVIVISLIGWLGMTTLETSRISAVTAARMDMMVDALVDLKKQVRTSSKGRYTRQDAQRDYTQNMRRFESIEKRITVLESGK